MNTATKVNYSRVGIVMLVSLLIASAWLVFPYLIQGRQMMSDVGDSARMTKGGRVSMYLTRFLVDHPDLELSATFATDEFFQYVDRTSAISNLRPDRNFIFFVSENIHEGQLAFDLPEVELRLGDNVYKPEHSIGPNLAEHHRITVYSIPRRAPDGAAIDINQYDSVRLYVSNQYLGSEEKLTFIGRWDAPYELPEELTSRADITPVAMLALGAGLLSSVLTPCLLQLVVIFGSIIGSFATVPGEAGFSAGQLTPHIRKKVMQIALAFVAGFTLLYTLAGAVIGSVGHTAQLLFSEYSRTVAIVSGVVVILMGIWIGVRGTQNMACRIPDRRAMSVTNKRDVASSLIVSMGYALGCTACFGGAIVATLIIYVGAIGSAAIGAGVMATFSIGVAIPFLLSAWYISRMDSVLVFLASKARAISLVSMVLIIIFGLILITDNFHVVSDAIYPHLGLN
ncbi:MAG: cytochrome c biogenesis CcdA family protein [Woeseiaceae bacterium]